MPANEEKFNQTEVAEDKETPANPEDAESLSKNLDWEKLKNIGEKFKEDIKNTSQETISQGDHLLTGALDSLGAGPEEKSAGQNYIKPVNAEIEQLAKEESAKIEGAAENNEDKKLKLFSKAYHHPEYRAQTAKQILEARKSGQDAKAVKQEFYQKTAMEKENFESQEKERSVAEIMKEKDLVICHAIPLTALQRKSTPENNPVLKTGGHQDFRTSVEILSGLSPTISTSIPLPERRGNGLYYPSGVILGEGKILSAQSRDSGSVAHGLYKRIPKDLGNQTAIQSKININEIVGKSEHYNELTVENPKIAGLFYDISELPPVPQPSLIFMEDFTKEENEKRNKFLEERYLKQQEERQKQEEERLGFEGYDLYKMKKFSKEMNVPLYFFKNENGELKKYKVEFLPREKEDYFDNVIVPQADKLLAKAGGNENDPEYRKFIENDYNSAKQAINEIRKEDYSLKEVTANDIYESKRDASDEERKKMIEDIKNKGILSASAEKEVDKKFQI